jgi:hypothetical protein
MRRRVAAKMVQLGGFEPPTSCSTDRRSNQLSYSCTGSDAQEATDNSLAFQAFRTAAKNAKSPAENRAL